jgi:hypothetical protein
MHRAFLSAAALAAGVVCLFSTASAGTLIPIPSFPGSTTTVIRGINDNNVITGTYTTSDGVIHGFVGTLDGNYTSFDHPNGQTTPEAINDDGYITGLANAPTADCPVLGCTFLRAPDGSFQAITKDRVPLDGIAQGIIFNTKFVGQYSFLDQNRHLFFYGYYGMGTKYRAALTLPFNTNRTSPRGFNGRHTVTGYFVDLDHNSVRTGFVLKDGVSTAVNYPDPNAFATLLEDVNDKGVIVGAWATQDGSVEQPFVYDFDNNAFSLIPVPGAAVAYANAVNNAGVVAVTDFTVSYIYCTRKSTCPNTPHGFAIAERWTPATSRSAFCRNACLEPLRTPARIRKSDAAAVRDAVNHDPVLKLEFGPSRGR